MAKKQQVDEIRYFIVERDSLSTYGSENGSDKAEAERLLSESDTSELVVIRGKVIRPMVQLEEPTK